MKPKSIYALDFAHAAGLDLSVGQAKVRIDMLTDDTMPDDEIHFLQVRNGQLDVAARIVNVGKPPG
jgi:hypothetical protein